MPIASECYRGILLHNWQARWGTSRDTIPFSAPILQREVAVRGWLKVFSDTDLFVWRWLFPFHYSPVTMSH
jgi:hypothetical protein